MTTTKKKTTTRKRSTRRKRTSGTQIIPGVNVSVSWKKLLGITQLKRWFTKKTGIPTTEAGLQRKIGQWVIGLFTGKNKLPGLKVDESLNVVSPKESIPEEKEELKKDSQNAIDNESVEEMPPQGPSF